VAPTAWPIWIEQDACFVVREHNGQKLAYVYFEDEPGRESAAKLLTRDVARRIAGTLRNCLAKKQQAHRVLRPVGHSLQCAARTTFVLWFRSSCKDYRLFAVPHDARGDPHVALHAARGDPHVGLHAARGDLRAALDAVPYRTLLERTSPERWVLERWVLERLAVPEPQHLTSLAR
jgi:hypothetical protein